MLRIHPRFVRRVREATTPQELYEPLQNAIELEHATIPPYLTAMISLKPETNREIWQIIHEVVIEEMLHMTIAANVLNALGGEPALNKPDFIPNYPGPLPMGIGDGLIVGLEAYSKEQVRNVFMEIEEPEERVPISRQIDSDDDEDEYHTIGDFYNALIDQLEKLPYEQLPGDPARQVVNPKMFSEKELFAITTKSEAIEGLKIIIEQGEGTDNTLPPSPIDSTDGGLAHYYRFEQLAEGYYLEWDEDEKELRLTDKEVPYEEENVYPLMPNTKSGCLPGGEAKRKAEEFNEAYSQLLNALHRTFNGEPDFLESTLSLMYDVKLVGEVLASMPYPGKPGVNVGPPFEYVMIGQTSECSNFEVNSRQRDGTLFTNDQTSEQSVTFRATGTWKTKRESKYNYGPEGKSRAKNKKAQYPDRTLYALLAVNSNNEVVGEGANITLTLQPNESIRFKVNDAYYLNNQGQLTVGWQFN